MRGQLDPLLGEGYGKGSTEVDRVEGKVRRSGGFAGWRPALFELLPEVLVLQPSVGEVSGESLWVQGCGLRDSALCGRIVVGPCRCGMRFKFFIEPVKADPLVCGGTCGPSCGRCHFPGNPADRMLLTLHLVNLFHVSTS